MLSVPVRWISSIAKRNLPSPKTPKSELSGHDPHLTESRVDPASIVAGPEPKTGNQNSKSPASGKDEKKSGESDGTGHLFDYSI